MSRLNTLKTKAEFNFIYKKGKRINLNYLTLIFLPSNDIRFAFVVSKKVGNAVIRNKIKRRLRAIARGLDIKNGTFLFLAKPNIKDITFHSLKNDIERCLLQLK